jgi:hypothetical protein
MRSISSNIYTHRQLPFQLQGLLFFFRRINDSIKLGYRITSQQTVLAFIYWSYFILEADHNGDRKSIVFCDKLKLRKQSVSDNLASLPGLEKVKLKVEKTLFHNIYKPHILHNLGILNLVEIFGWNNQRPRYI